MKKKLKALAFLGIAALLVCVALIFLLSDMAESPVEIADPVTELVSRDKGELKSVSVSCGSYQWEAYVNPDGRLVFEGLEDYPLNEKEMEALWEYSCLVRSQKTVENSGPLEDYGLDSASALFVSVEYTDGDTFDFRIGDRVPGTDTDSFYTLLNDKVCVMYRLHIEPFLQKSENYLNKQLSPSNENANYILAYLSVSKADEEAPLVVAYDKAEQTETGQYMSAYKMVSPRQCSITYNEKSSSFMQSIFGMSADIYDVDPTEEELSDCGLEEAYVTVQAAFMDTAGQSYSMEFFVSQPDEDGFSYLIMSGRDIIYRLPVNGAAWYTTSWEDVVGKQIIMPSIKSVQKLSIKTPSDQLVLEIDYKNEAFSVIGGNQEFSEAEYKKLYQTIILSEVDELTDAFPEDGAAELLEICFQYISGESDTISFADSSVRQCCVLKDGEPFGLIRKTAVDTILEAFSHFISGEEIIVRF